MPYKDPAKAKECSRRACQRYWHKNKKKLRAYRDAARRAYRKWSVDLKAQQKCAVCGFHNPAALDYHHVDGAEKDNEVSILIRNMHKRETVLAEIAKCIVLCSNCHRIHHHGKFYGSRSSMVERKIVALEKRVRSSSRTPPTHGSLAQG